MVYPQVKIMQKKSCLGVKEMSDFIWACKGSKLEKTVCIAAARTMGSWLYVLFLSFFFLLSVLEFELRVSCLLGRRSTTWVAPPAHFCDGLIWDRVSQTISPDWFQTRIFLISASWVARITGLSHRYLLYVSFLGGGRRGAAAAAGQLPHIFMDLSFNISQIDNT
jgi:hypothetical protein